MCLKYVHAKTTAEKLAYNFDLDLIVLHARLLKTF